MLSEDYDDAWPLSSCQRGRCRGRKVWVYGVSVWSCIPLQLSSAPCAIQTEQAQPCARRQREAEIAEQRVAAQLLGNGCRGEQALGAAPHRYRTRAGVLSWM